MSHVGDLSGMFCRCSSKTLRWLTTIVLSVGVLAPPLTTLAIAQAPLASWKQGFALGDLDAPGNFEDAALCTTTFDDDGDGPNPPSLIVGGVFTIAGGLQASHIARWNGYSWSPMDQGMVASVRALAVFDEDGMGPGLPALFAAGNFGAAGGAPAYGVARWNGSGWEPLGSGLITTPNLVGSGDAMCVYDDGSGPALYVGGFFTHAGGIEASCIARWDGSAWSPLGSGVQGAEGARVYSLCVFDEDGAGGLPPALFVGGVFDTAGGAAASNIARWDGHQWQAVGSGSDFGVLALTPFDGGAGAELYAGGGFTMMGGAECRRLARWNGSSWSSVGDGANATVTSLTIYTGPIGTQPTLIAGGYFSSMGSVLAGGIAAWDGTNWAPLGIGVAGEGVPVVLSASALADSELGVEALYAVGKFHRAGAALVRNIARWDGVSWRPLGKGARGDSALALQALEGQFAGSMAVCGSFSALGGAAINDVALWDGEEWAPLGEGLGGTGTSLAQFDDDLYVAGTFSAAGGAPASRIARWDGDSWSPLGAGLTGGAFTGAYALKTLDPDGSGPDPTALFVGGLFTAAGTTPASNIARWDGAQWHALGGGVNGYVFALAGFDDGSGPALYVGGSFFNAGGVGQPGAVQAANIARWNGVNWSALDVGVDGPVRALAVFDDDGAGPTPPALYLGGDFTLTNAGPALGVARWSGSAWSALGTGLGGVLTPSCSALRVADAGGAGPGAPALVVAGTFDTAGGVTARNIARWDGASWAPLDAGGVGTNGQVRALATFDDDGAGPTPPALYLGGAFSMAGDVSSVRIARFGAAAAAPCPGDTNGDNFVNFADLNACLGAFGIATGATLAQGDIDGDGDVDFADLNVILSNFGGAC